MQKISKIFLLVFSMMCCGLQYAFPEWTLRLSDQGYTGYTDTTTTITNTTDTTTSTTSSTSSTTTTFTTTTTLKPQITSYPDEPKILEPNNEAVLASGPVILKAGAFLNIDGDTHGTTIWVIKRFDDPDISYTIDSGAVTEFAFEKAYGELDEGFKYVWKVGYQGYSSLKISWSKESSFKIGKSVSDNSVKIPQGIETKDFKIVSFVQWADNPDSINIFNSLLQGGYDTTNYKIGTFDSESGNYVEFGSNLKIEPGKAYWILARNGLNTILNGIPVNNIKDVKVGLKNGWNMIACPNNKVYNWAGVQITVYNDSGNKIFGPVSISKLPEDNNYIDKHLWLWNNGDYDSNTSNIEPYKGYWIKTKAKNVYLKFPANTQALRQANKMVLREATEKPPMPMSFSETNTSKTSENSGGGGGCFINSLIN